MWEQAARVEADLKRERTRTAELRAALKTARATAAKAERARKTLARAPEVRVARRLRRTINRALPRGTARGRLARRALGSVRSS